MSDITMTVLAAIPAIGLFVFLFHQFFAPEKRPRPSDCKACKTRWKTARFENPPVIKNGDSLTVTYRPRKANWFWAFLLRIWRKR